MLIGSPENRWRQSEAIQKADCHLNCVPKEADDSMSQSCPLFPRTQSRALLEEKRQGIGVLRWCVLHAKFRRVGASARD